MKNITVTDTHKEFDTVALENGREVILQESEAVKALAKRLDHNFAEAVRVILQCRGRVIFTGIGKSGHVARKLASTFTSTGTPAFFLHPAEGAHGDLGLVQKDDLLIALSKSGTTAELDMIFPIINRLKLKSILLTGQANSRLSERVTITLDCAVEAEACPHNLAPTTSATAAMVMGHALAVSVLKAREFTSEDFAALHPAGALGQRLLLRVCDKMHTGHSIPVVPPSKPVRETIFEITGKRLGCAVVADSENHLLGIFTDGDLRRLTQREEKFLDLPTESGMTPNPKCIHTDALLDEALSLMERHTITALPVVDDDHKVVGILHVHDILGGDPLQANRSRE